MENGEALFLKVIKQLSEGGILTDIVLIGSWVLPIYRAYFDNAPGIPVLRTNDVDFLIGAPPGIGCKFDIPRALSELGFEPEWSLTGGYCKYVHPDMEVEFLVPSQGRGTIKAVSVKALCVEAQPLRFLSLAYDRSMVVSFHDYSIRVPEPEAFVLLKLLVIPKRKDRVKIEKDAYTARSIGEYLLSSACHRALLFDMLDGLPKGWQKSIRNTAQEHFPELLNRTL